MAKKSDELFEETESLRSDELPETEESDSPAATEQSAGETPKVSAKSDDDDGFSVEIPDDLPEKVKKTLEAVRGDRRRDRDKWKKTEERLVKQFERSEKERQALLAQLTQRPAHAEPAQKPSEKRVDFWTTPEEFIAHQNETVSKAILAELDKRESARTEKLVKASQRRMRSEHDDFDEVEHAVLEKARLEPQRFGWIFEEAIASGDPARFIYTEGRRAVGLESGESERLRAATARIAELESQLKQRSSAGVVDDDGEPVRRTHKSIAGARGTGVGHTADWPGRQAFDQLFPD